MERRRQRQRRSEEHDQRRPSNEADGNLDEMFYGTEEDSESEDTATDLQRPGRAARRRAAVVGGGGGTEGHGPGQGGPEG